VWAVVLVVALAHLAAHTRLNLCSNTNTLTWLEGLDFRSYTQNLANDFVADAERCCCQVTPSSSDCVNIGSADTAAFVLDVDIVVFEVLGSELNAVSILSTQFVCVTCLLLLEFSPFVGVVDHETLELFWSCCHVVV
jgi:hypothetical protein